MSGRRGSRKSLSSPLGKFAKNRGTLTLHQKPCDFNINLPKELRPLPCQEFFLGAYLIKELWIRIISESHRGLAGGCRGGETISVLTGGMSVEWEGSGWSRVRAERVDGEGVASKAASALVTARLSSPSRTRSRTSRARLLKDLVGGGESGE